MKYINIQAYESDEVGNTSIDYEGMIDGDEVLRVARLIWMDLDADLPEEGPHWHIFVNYLHGTMDQGGMLPVTLRSHALEVLAFIQEYLPLDNGVTSVLKCDYRYGD